MSSENTTTKSLSIGRNASFISSMNVQFHERSWGMGETERCDCVLVVAVAWAERRLGDVLTLDANLLVDLLSESNFER